MHTFPTQAVILAGGQGSRLRPYTDDRPKPMVEIPGTGTPIIGHQLSWLAAEGVTDAVVSCGHLAEVLQEWLESAACCSGSPPSWRPNRWGAVAG
ncbi:nucleotidyltransferase family protein [Streptomyces californicus]